MKIPCLFQLFKCHPISKYLVQQPITVRSSNLPNRWGKPGSISRGYLERPRNDLLGSGPHSKRGMAQRAPLRAAPSRAPSLVGLFNSPKSLQTDMQFVSFFSSGERKLHIRVALLNMKIHSLIIVFAINQLMDFTTPWRWNRGQKQNWLPGLLEKPELLALRRIRR